MSAPAPGTLPTALPKGARYALLLVALMNAISLLDRQVLAILAPAIKADLKVGDAEMGLLYGTVFALFYALFSLPLGRLADGWTRSKLLALAIAFWSAATALGGMASGFAMLAASRLGVGVGEAASQPAGTSLIYDYWPKHRRGFVMAILASAIALGLGGSLILGGVAASWWDHAWGLSPSHSAPAPFGLKGWQFAFFMAALPGFVLAGFMWFLKEPPRGTMDGISSPPDPAPFRASGAVLASVVPGFNWISLARGGASARAWRFNLAALALIVLAMSGLVALCSAYSPRPSLAFGLIALSPHVLQWGVIGFGLYVIVNLMQNMAQTDAQAYRVITRSPTLIMVMLVGALQSVLNYGMMSFNPSFLMKYYGLSMKDTALQFGLVSAGMGILGPLLWGPLADWLQKRFPGVGRAWLGLFCMGVSPLLSFWVYWAGDASAFYWRFLAYSLVLTGWLPPLYAIMYEQVLPRMRGITASVYLLVSTILGLGIGPYVVGVLSDATGNLRGSMLTINVVAIPIVVLMLLVARRAHGDEAALMERAN